MPVVGYYDAPADNESYIQSIVELLVRVAGFDALYKVIVDTVVAPKYGGGHQTQELLGPAIEISVLIRNAVQAEEPLDTKMAAFEDPGIHLLTIGMRLIKPRSHTKPPT